MFFTSRRNTSPARLTPNGADAPECRRMASQWRAAHPDALSRTRTLRTALENDMKLCFVIMPIGSGDAYEVYLNRYANIIKPAIEGHLSEGTRVFDAIRADFITKTGSINKTVIQHIYNADLVIADLTDL